MELYLDALMMPLEINSRNVKVDHEHGLALGFLSEKIGFKHH